MADIHHHAIRHYERVLELASAVDEPAMDVDDAAPAPVKSDFSRDAAYNLSQLYLTLGWPDRARALAERWLSF